MATVSLFYPEHMKALSMKYIHDVINVITSRIKTLDEMVAQGLDTEIKKSDGLGS